MSAVVVNPYGDKELLPSALERQFRDGCQELSLESLFWDGIVFQVSFKAVTYSPCNNNPALFKLF